MGSKRNIIPVLFDVIKDIKFDTFLDAFSGSGVVSYAFKNAGKTVFSNDFMKYCYSISHSTIENSHVILTNNDIQLLLKENKNKNSFIETMFKNLYFTDTENRFIDNVLANIREIKNNYKTSLARAALSRACLKKRPRGVFTYVGHRYDDGRRDLRVTLKQQFIEAIHVYNQAIIDNGKENRSFCLDVFDLDIKPDLVYFDPPYYTPLSDNDYLRRYHFLEGICCDWQGVEILHNTKTKKLKKYPTPFDSKKDVSGAFLKLFERFKDSIIVLSYSSNSQPQKEELLLMLKDFKSNVTIYEIDHKYSFGTHNHKIGNNRNSVKEYLFVAK